MKLNPSGKCWCNCGERTVAGSFFLPGHEQRAVSAIIEHYFCDARGFVAAFGWQPGEPRFESRAACMEFVIKLVELPALYSVNITLEYTNIDDRTGPLLHEHGAEVLAFDLSDRVVPFNVVSGAGTVCEILIPFDDVLSVFLSPPNGHPHRKCTVRIAGAIRLLENGLKEYVAIGTR